VLRYIPIVPKLLQRVEIIGVTIMEK